MRSRRTAVLGGSGFIGRYVVKRLAARGDVVPAGCRNAEEAKMLRALPLIGGGESRFQPVYVDDVADAVIKCLEDPATAGRTYELGGPKTYTFRDLLDLLLQEIRRKRWFIDLPFGVAGLQARLMSILPNPPLTPDQVELLKRDNVVSPGALTLSSLGIAPTQV